MSEYKDFMSELTLEPALEDMPKAEAVEETAIRSALRTPRFALATCPLPRFWPTKVVEARAMDCMGRNRS